MDHPHIKSLGPGDKVPGSCPGVYSILPSKFSKEKAGAGGIITLAIPYVKKWGGYILTEAGHSFHSCLHTKFAVTSHSFSK